MPQVQVSWSSVRRRKNGKPVVSPGCLGSVWGSHTNDYRAWSKAGESRTQCSGACAPPSLPLRCRIRDILPWRQAANITESCCRSLFLERGLLLLCPLLLPDPFSALFSMTQPPRSSLAVPYPLLKSEAGCPRASRASQESLENASTSWSSGEMPAREMSGCSHATQLRQAGTSHATLSARSVAFP